MPSFADFDGGVDAPFFEWKRLVQWRGIHWLCEKMTNLYFEIQMFIVNRSGVHIITIN